MIDEAWYPCVYELGNPPAKVQMGGPLFSNLDDTDYQMMFRLPLPLIKGNLRLHIMGLRIGVLGADPGNFVSRVSVVGMTHTAAKAVNDVSEHLTGQQLKSFPIPSHDASSYEAVMVRIWCTVSEAHKLHITSVSLHCYYQ